MTAFCDLAALVCFLVAVILTLITPAPARWTWATFVALGLLAWAVPIALTAAKISHS
jgi:hypothetical protein